MRLAAVQAIDFVTPVDNSGTDDQPVRLRFAQTQLPESIGDRRRSLSAQQQSVAHVTCVAGVSGDALGRITEPVVVVLDRNDGVGAMHEHRDVPGLRQGICCALNEQLQRMWPLSRVREIADGDGAAVGLEAQ
jgi:hypothetical protein